MNANFHQVLPVSPQPPTKTTTTEPWPIPQYFPGFDQQPWFHPAYVPPSGHWEWIPYCPRYIPPYIGPCAACANGGACMCVIPNQITCSANAAVEDDFFAVRSFTYQGDGTLVHQ